jgi:hypothetical protein
MNYDFHSMNNLLSNWIKENKSFSIVRIDNTMECVLYCQYKNKEISQQQFNEQALIEGGVYPATTKYAFEVVIPTITNEMHKADALAFLDFSGYNLEEEQDFLNVFGDKPRFFTGHSYSVLDPGCLIVGARFGKPENPWTENLKGKKVLVISPLYETIMQQWEKRDLIWGKDKDKIVPFDLVGCIRSPHHPLLDENQFPGCTTWAENIEYIKNEILKYDYDVLLSSVSLQSSVFANFARDNGKIGIQTGGILQLFFGIKGNRWMNHQGYFDWHKMMNEHWIYPLKADEPQRKKQYSFLETTYAYWGNN